MTPDSSTPSWAVPGSLDKHGYFECANCGERVPPHWKACQCCCEHEEAVLCEYEDEYGDKWLGVDCAICGDSYLDPKFILENFELVRKKNPTPTEI